MYLLVAAFLYVSFFVGAFWAEAYLTHYGDFLLSRGELALKLHLLLFILPATIFLSLAFAEVQPGRLLAGFDKLGDRRPSSLPAVLLALLVFGLVMLVRACVLRWSVITDDENVYHFQAHLLAAGRLYAPSMPEPLRSFFDNAFIVNNGRWFGQYFLGHPAVLALALNVGVIEYVGALEGALTLLLAVGIARRLFSERVAILTGALLALSPFFIFVSATHLSQPSSMLFLMLFIYGAFRLEDSPRPMGWWMLTAAALVAAVFTRPQTTLVLSLPFLARITRLLAKGDLRMGWGPLVAALIILGGAAGFLAVNHALTGSVFRTGYQAYMAQGDEKQFPVGAVTAVREISQNVAQLNFWLLGWPLSLGFVALFYRSPKTWTLAAVPIGALLWYGLVNPATVAPVGPVYYAETIVPLVILTGSGIERAVVFLRQHIGDALPTRTVIAAPVAGLLACLLAFVPFETASLRLMADVTQAPYDMVEAHGLNHALVFVRSLPAQVVSPGSWAFYHRNNSPGLDDRVLFVRDLGPERNRALVRYLADRTPYWMGMREGRLVLRPLGFSE